MLIKGSKLTVTQRQQVLAAFPYRWTVENCQRAATFMQRGGYGAPTTAPETDAAWIDAHAFHFLKDGSRLVARRNYAEPAYMADEE
jgi:hypothetical protein